MKVICLQIAPELGQVSKNIERADRLLREVCPADVDLLVLPELAFSGLSIALTLHRFRAESMFRI